MNLNVASTIAAAKLFVTDNATAIAGVFLFVLLGLFVAFWTKSGSKKAVSAPNSQKPAAELLLFTASWCPYCKAAMPEWNAVKAELSGKIIMREIDCSDPEGPNKHLCDEFNITSYPTIKLVVGSTVSTFDAKPTRELIREFVHTMA